MNVSGTINALRIIWAPKLFIPQLTVPTFAQLPVPIPPKDPHGRPIKVVVLDKDNCFAAPHEDRVWPDYADKWAQLNKAYPGRLLIVSNTAGSSDDSSGSGAKRLEANTGVKVFEHATKKPGCGPELVAHLRREGLIESPDEVAVVGDRLMTDVLMANLMGSQSVWVTEGVKPSKSVFSQFEKAFYRFKKRSDSNDSS